jgi:hypothetical protein
MFCLVNLYLYNQVQFLVSLLQPRSVSWISIYTTMFSILSLSYNHVLSRESLSVQPRSVSCIIPTTMFCLVNLHLYNQVQSLVFFLQPCPVSRISTCTTRFSLLYFSYNHVLCLVNLHLYNHVQSLVFFLQQCPRRVTPNYLHTFLRIAPVWYNKSNYVRLSSSLYNYCICDHVVSLVLGLLYNHVQFHVFSYNNVLSLVFLLQLYPSPVFLLKLDPVSPITMSCRLHCSNSHVLYLVLRQ